ncbi:MAG: hypothetical protein QOF65_58 [Thermoleophilaceae bacterium]|jgi:hypothetical protein|nr:hypothetical protein [Thermoleophilaceae bacterium]
MIAACSARRAAPLAPSEATPDGRPTRPDKLSIWPTEDERFGIDVLYVGPQGHRRAEIVIRQIEAAGVAVVLRHEGENGWIVRFGPVSREDMLAVLNGYVW